TDQHLLKRLILLLARQNLQALHEWQTGIDHDRKLASEDCEFFGVHAAAEGWNIEFLPLLGHLRRRDLLALQQRRKLRLVRGGHHPADTGAGATCSLIFIIRHWIASSVL